VTHTLGQGALHFRIGQKAELISRGKVLHTIRPLKERPLQSAVALIIRELTYHHPAFLEREDGTLVAWYRYVYAPRTGGAYDSHHRTAGIAGCTRRRGGGLAAPGARAASGETWWSREKLRRNHVNDRGDKCQMRHT